MGKVSDDATILNIKHEVLTEVAKLAFAGELEEKKENIPFEMIRALKRVSAAVFIKSVKSSDRESDWRKGNAPGIKRAAISFRLLTRHVKNVPFLPDMW